MRLAAWFRYSAHTCQRHAWTVLLAALVLATASGWYTAGNLGMDTDTSRLFPDDLPWQQVSAEFDAAFPQDNDVLVVVIDAGIPERAEKAVSRLAERLHTTPLVRSVRRPDDGDFFKRNGLLYLDPATLSALSARIVEAQPLFGSIAGDPTLRGLFQTLARAAEAAAGGDFDWQRLAAPLTAIADSVSAALEGRTRYLSWRELVSGQAASDDDRRRFLLVQPVLDYGALMPGAEASEAVRAAARELGLTPDNGIRVRLTGSVALSDEEFGSVAEGTRLAALLSLSLVTVLLLLAVRSVKLVLAIVVTLAVGILATFAFATAAVGSLNLISIAFVVLFVGLAVDFGIQVAVRYRNQHFHDGDTGTAIAATAERVGPSLALAAFATSAGFLSLTPTDYAGVAELGLIAGVGLAIALLLNLTLLPALIALLHPPAGKVPPGLAMLAPLDRLLQRRRHGVLLLAALLMLAGGVSTSRLQFDSDPLKLKDPSSESVSTLADLVGSPNATPFTIDVLAPDLDHARRLAELLAALPEVDKVITAASFVPDGQPAALSSIEDLALLVGPMTVPDAAPVPGPADAVLAAVAATSAALAEAPPGTPAGDAAERLRPLLVRLPAVWSDIAPRLAELLLDSLPQAVRDLQLALDPAPVTLDSLPESLHRDWLTDDGRARIEVFPAGDTRDSAALGGFTEAVRALAPRATGAPVNIQESGRLVVGAFIEAGWIALAVIGVMLVVVLRRLRDVALVLAPLLLAGLLTVLVCVLLSLPLNFANIIALPLLLGIGVSFAIYFVLDWRRGERAPLVSPTARGVLFSALTTAAAFGSLALSSHAGTASMGILLSISLASTLAATLLVLPALLGPPPADDV